MSRWHPAEIEAAKADTDLVALIGHRVELRKHGHEFVGLCPFHTERTPSFTVRPDRGFWHCFGCGRHGDAISWLMETEAGGDFALAMEILTGDRAPSEAEIRQNKLNGERRSLERAKRQAHMASIARRIWREASSPAPSGPVARYLARRVPGMGLAEIPPTIRAHAALPVYRPDPLDDDRSKPSGRALPAMVSALQPSAGAPGAALVAVHVTFLAESSDGWDKAPQDRRGEPGSGLVPRAKIILGPKSGAVVRLGPAARHIDLGEGIETMLAVRAALSGDDNRSAWSAGTGENLWKIEMPAGVESVTLWADMDDNGAGERHARKAAERLAGSGHRVTLAKPGIIPR